MMTRKLTLLIIILLVSCTPVTRYEGKLIKEPVPEAPPPPQLMLAPEKEESVFEHKLFTFKATNVPLYQVLSPLAQQAGLNLVFDPEVNKETPVTVDFTNVTLQEALECILDPLDLIYKIDGNNLRIKVFDTVVFELGYIPQPNLVKVKVGGDVLGSAQGEGGLTGDIQVQAETPKEAQDIWKMIDASLKKLVSSEGSYVINSFSGTIMVTDRKKNLEKIKKFLETIKESLGRQVLIETKVIEVTLSDENSYGINWSLITQNGPHSSLSLSQNLSLSQPVFEITLNAGEVEALLNFLQSVGEVRVLSQPRISVINGQTAIFSVGKVQAYWELTAQGGGAQVGTPMVYPEKKSVLVGLLMGVIPYIESDGWVILHVAPIVSDVTEWASYTWQGQSLRAPNVDIRETSTVIKVRDGSTVVIGGLITHRKKKTVKAVPLISQLPLIGHLFQRVEYKEERAELVILLTPHIKNPERGL